MTDFEKDRAVFYKMQDELEDLHLDYDRHLENQQRALERLDEYLWDRCFTQSGRLNITPDDLGYVNAYVRVTSELRKVYQERLDRCSNGYSKAKDRFVDMALFSDEDSDED